MIGIDVIREKFQKVCVGEGRYIGLVFRMPGKPREFGTARIIGKTDDPERAMITADNIGQECVALVELDKKESAWLAAKRGNRMAIIEAICEKIGEAGFAS